MASAQQDLVIRMKTNSTEFNQGIDKAKGKLGEFKNEGSKAGDGMAKGLAAAKTAIAKIAIAVGAATAAIKTYGSFAKQTQTWGDELNNTLSACKTTWQTLQSEIIQGGNIAVGRIRELYNEAYKLAQLKDQMGTLQISQRLNRSLYLTPYNEARAEYQEAKASGDEEGMRKAYQEMMRNLNEYAKESQGLISTSKQAAQQLLKAHGITLKENQSIEDLVKEVRNAQNGNLMGITETLRELSKPREIKMYSPTVGTYSEPVGGREWGKSEMRKLGYSEAQIAAAERQLQMAELNDQSYNEFANDIMAASDALNEIAMLRKSTARLTKEQTVTANTVTITSNSTNIEGFERQELIPQLKPIGNENTQIQFYPNAAKPLDPYVEANMLAQAALEQLEKEEEEMARKDAWQKKINEVNVYGAAIGHLSNAFANLAGVMNDTSPMKKFMNVMASVVGGIQNMIQVYTSLVAVESVQRAIESGEGIPFPYNLVAIAAAAATLTGIIATIVSNTKSQNFASGGIVQGSGWAARHDGVHTNLTAGEMVLNQHQQMSLWRMLIGGGANQYANVEFIIRGEDLVGTIDNYNKNANY